MINEEITNLNDKENIFEMSYESRALDTDTLDAPPGHVITGKCSLISACVLLFYNLSTVVQRTVIEFSPFRNYQQTHPAGITQWPNLSWPCVAGSNELHIETAIHYIKVF